MDKQIKWKKALDKDVTEFAQTDTAKQAKRDMFYAIMDNLDLEEDPTISFAQAEEIVETMSTKKKPLKSNNFHSLYLGGFSAVAAVLAVVIVGRTQLIGPSITPTPIFDPPLAQTDIPTEILQPATPYRTVATNNDFYLSYSEEDRKYGSRDILVHSRSGKVNWDSVSLTDSEQDAVLPISINSNDNTICLPETETDLYFEIKDENGNQIECIIPKYI